MPRPFIILVAALWVLACSPPQEWDALAPHHVIIITVDTLRADHLAPYGYPRDTAPNLTALANKGVLFERAVSTSATTIPAHVSLFTGVHPYEHGIRKNGGGVLPARLKTVAEIYAEQGWSTGAFLGAAHSFKASGLDRGFETFNLPDRPTRTAQATVTAALEWMQKSGDEKPMFLWIHLWDVHSPYEPTELFSLGSH